jgi:hypothetical protein
VMPGGERIALKAESPAPNAVVTAWVQSRCDPARDWDRTPAAITWRLRYKGQ